ncbi:MAG: ribonuclease III [Bacillota bacterium]|nr:ribonuclease III [Bacillota bacterium]
MLSDKKLKELSDKLRYDFKDKTLLVTALTHSSYVNENKLKYSSNNERLEYLGDAVLDAAISDYLYFKYREVEEGTLTKERAAIVCEASLSMCGKALGLGDYLILGKGEEHNGGRERPSMIADAVEAVIGAIYIDGGWDPAKKTALFILENVIQKASVGQINRDYKSLVQEKYQASGEVSICYEVAKEEGPDHDKTFYIDLIINGKTLGRGVGKSKKEAEQRAAQLVYESGE